MSPLFTESRLPRAVALATVLLAAGASVASPRPAAADAGAMDVELQLGEEVFQELKGKGEIVATSSLYDVLTPIAARITQAAQPQYEHPFRFFLVHQAQPNAFAVPGGYVFVTDSLLFFVKNTEELAGTLCHEVAHTIHHDSLELMEKRRKLILRELTAGVLLGPTRAHLLTIALLGKLNSLGYSREVESRADVTGADICASARYNPWGLVWLFQDFKSANVGELPELLSDHPDDEHRVQTVEEHFRKNPGVFGKFDSNPKSAAPVVLPKDTSETFLR